MTILDALSDSISLITTAARALAGAQAEGGKLDVREASDELVTLQHGVGQLRRAHEALQLAFSRAAKFALEEDRKFAKRG